MTAVAVVVVVGAIDASVVFTAPQPEPASTHQLSDPNDEDLLAAGRTILVRQEVPGDVAVAGADVTIDGGVAGYVMSAGRHVTLSGRVGNDLWAAGETVDVASAIGNNAMIAGRTVTVHGGATVAGNARLAGNTVHSEGRVTHNLRVAGRVVSIGGDVGGTVTAAGDRISVLPTAVIHGDFVVESPRPPDVSPDARILGRVRHEPAGARGGWMAWPNVWLWSFLGLFILGAAIYFVAPMWPREVGGVLRARPGASLFSGLVLLLLVPVAIVAFAVTMVGIPLALVALGLYMALLLLSAALVSYRLGDWILTRLGRVWVSRWLPLTVGVLALSLMMSLPIVGLFVSLVVMTWGAGAIFLERRGYQSPYEALVPRGQQ
jgi:cytoskeletal protein CcmA (bactofilin family)